MFILLGIIDFLLRPRNAFDAMGNVFGQGAAGAAAGLAQQPAAGVIQNMPQPLDVFDRVFNNVGIAANGGVQGIAGLVVPQPLVNGGIAGAFGQRLAGAAQAGQIAGQNIPGPQDVFGVFRQGVMGVAGLALPQQQNGFAQIAGIQVGGMAGAAQAGVKAIGAKAIKKVVNKEPQQEPFNILNIFGRVVNWFRRLFGG